MLQAADEVQGEEVGSLVDLPIFGDV